MIDRPEPYDAAVSFLDEHFPDAVAAFLGGSVVTEHRTPTSDLDITVVMADLPTPYRETFWHEGWLVEAFVHTRDSLDYYFERDEERRVRTMFRLCSDSVVVVDRAGTAAEIRQHAAERLEAGPPEPSQEQVDTLRYSLSSLLDDLAGADREDELAFISGQVLGQAAELALLAAGEWSGIGKALARELGAFDPDLAERLVNAHRMVVTEGDTAPLYRCALQVLDSAGGPLLAGFRQEAPAAAAAHRRPAPDKQA